MISPNKPYNLPQNPNIFNEKGIKFIELIKNVKEIIEKLSKKLWEDYEGVTEMINEQDKDIQLWQDLIEKIENKIQTIYNELGCWNMAYEDHELVIKELVKECRIFYF